MREQERYRMRWSLQVKGMKEKKDENIRANVAQVLKKIVPELDSKMEDAADVTHRTGTRDDDRNRNVIVLFTQRQIKEEIWSKGYVICKEEGISFA